MRVAGVDVAAATRSLTKIPISSPHLAKHTLETHVTRSLLGGFGHPRTPYYVEEFLHSAKAARMLLLLLPRLPSSRPWWR
jgi:hypothetical protein